MASVFAPILFFEYFVIDAVFAPVVFAILSAVTTSGVVPDYDPHRARSSGVRSAAACLIAWESVNAQAFLFILMNF